jgi:hypothetical protein
MHFNMQIQYFLKISRLDAIQALSFSFLLLSQAFVMSRSIADNGLPVTGLTFTHLTILCLSLLSSLTIPFYTNNILSDSQCGTYVDSSFSLSLSFSVSMFNTLGESFSMSQGQILVHYRIWIIRSSEFVIFLVIGFLLYNCHIGHVRIVIFRLHMFEIPCLILV